MLAGTLEGYKGNDRIPGSALKITGGNGSIHQTSIGYAMGDPGGSGKGARGVVDVSSGDWDFAGNEYHRGDTGVSTPLIAATGSASVSSRGWNRRSDESWSARPGVTGDVDSDRTLVRL
jgi:hypothetical protein